MTAIEYRILKFEYVIEKPVVATHTFFAVATFSKISSFVISDLQKDFNQDNLSVVCLQFYKHNSLNILAINICFHI